MNTITMGVGLAKNVFPMCEMDGARHVSQGPGLKRAAFAIGLEECSAAHH